MWWAQLLAEWAHLKNAPGASPTFRSFSGKNNGPAQRAGPSVSNGLLAAPQAEADAAQENEEGAQGSSQEWESRHRQGNP